MNRMFDQAADLEQQQRDDALAAALAGIESARAHLLAQSATHCEVADCGEPIPEARRQAQPGCRFCVACQARIEKHPALRRQYA